MLKELLRALYAIIDAIKTKSGENDGGDNKEDSRNYAMYTYTEGGGHRIYNSELIKIDDLRGKINNPEVLLHLGCDKEAFEGIVVKYREGENPNEYGFDGDNYIECTRSQVNQVLEAIEDENVFSKIIVGNSGIASGELCNLTDFSEDTTFYVNSAYNMFVCVDGVMMFCLKHDIS